VVDCRLEPWVGTKQGIVRPRAQTYNLLHYSLFCANRGLEPTIYCTIPCFVPTKGSNLQSTALFPVLSQPKAQLHVFVYISTDVCNCISGVRGNSAVDCRFEPLGWDKTGNSAVDWMI
jgi:hypothetical protein